MADIFISYSSKDREKAEQLTELLGSAGLSVWIYDAIESCKTLVVMLSPSSIESKNVAREVSLAFEKNKKILPLDLEPVELTRDLGYHLAGLQRTSMTNIDAIIRALGKLGLEATQTPVLKLVKETDSRKSLMILPFEDLSPTADNGWFADGIASELITALTHIKALRVADQQSTKDFKRYQGTLPVYAREMNIRYFIQGDVRKFGDNIKITSRLLDIETGDHLWQDSMKGTMEDIFDIQEKVAEKVVEGLKVYLAPEEQKKLTERGTENAEAYELNLKGIEYFDRNTKDGFELALQLWSEAIALDPGYAMAYANKANALAALFRTYSPDTRLFDDGLALVREALRLKPDLWKANLPLSQILVLQGKLEEAESAAKDYIRNAPDDYLSHAALAVFYTNTGQTVKAITSYEEALKRKPENLVTLFNLVSSCYSGKELVKQKMYADIAIPKYEKHLKLFPDDEHKRVSYTILLHLAGREEEAAAAARKLSNIKDGSSLSNIARLQCLLKDYEAGLTMIVKAIDAGFRNIASLRSFLNDDECIGTLKGTPEWENVRLMVEKIEMETRKNG
jgi:adenylate cyclase